jgi:hypothetical protein
MDDVTHHGFQVFEGKKQNSNETHGFFEVFFQNTRNQWFFDY